MKVTIKKIANHADAIVPVNSTKPSIIADS